ncbi:hypothetical protein BpHYR1_011318 [Brachionus plicatilis]|uniref:Uncharacterized protein n=1 Tax=Brachionus plicatilis TaxID=10195 RepID=A0A3M7Q202_BRAPC|nr:hypothetical protein BpHYR1_011318 [Brachionus plicatilis]
MVSALQKYFLYHPRLHKISIPYDPFLQIVLFFLFLYTVVNSSQLQIRKLQLLEQNYLEPLVWHDHRLAMACIGSLKVFPGRKGSPFIIIKVAKLDYLFIEISIENTKRTLLYKFKKCLYKKDYIKVKKVIFEIIKNNFLALIIKTQYKMKLLYKIVNSVTTITEICFKSKLFESVSNFFSLLTIFIFVLSRFDTVLIKAGDEIFIFSVLTSRSATFGSGLKISCSKSSFFSSILFDSVLIFSSTCSILIWFSLTSSFSSSVFIFLSSLKRFKALRIGLGSFTNVVLAINFSSSVISALLD